MEERLRRPHVSGAAILVDSLMKDENTLNAWTCLHFLPKFKQEAGTQEFLISLVTKSIVSIFYRIVSLSLSYLSY